MIVKSTPDEITAASVSVRETEQKIETLKSQGKKVHIIWDFDFVLASGRSDDVFELVDYNLEKYFEYESRLLWEKPESGIWLSLATKIGRLHESQDIVTARSSYLAFRVMYFCMMTSASPNWVRWMLFLGHQTKSESFRIILESLRKDPDFYVIYVDDAKKHVDSFNALSKELNMEDRTSGILSPRIRLYTGEQLEAHYRAVMAVTGDKPVVIPHEINGYGGFTVLPNGINDFRKQTMGNFINTHKEAVVEALRPILEAFHTKMMPDKPMTIDSLYFCYELLKDSH